MNRLYTVFVLYLCAVVVYSASIESEKDNRVELIDVSGGDEKIQQKIQDGTIDRMFDFLLKEKPEDDKRLHEKQQQNATRHRRQAYGQGGYGAPPPPPPQLPRNQIADGGLGSEFPDFYDFYPNDFLYDYYEWVCTENNCLLCNVLTSECCNPNVNVNCFLPDSCLNNPCLSGGTCIPSQTLDNQPDFICACYPGFTGKYCQLTNEFFFPPLPPPPPPAPAPYQPPQYNYQPPPQPYQPPPQPYQPPPQYQPPQQQYQPQAPAPAPYQPPPPPPPQPQQPQPSYGGSNNNNNLGPIPLGPIPLGPNGPQNVQGIARGPIIVAQPPPPIRGPIPGPPPPIRGPIPGPPAPGPIPLNAQQRPMVVPPSPPPRK